MNSYHYSGRYYTYYWLDVTEWFAFDYSPTKFATFHVMARGYWGEDLLDRTTSSIINNQVNNRVFYEEYWDQLYWRLNDTIIISWYKGYEPIIPTCTASDTFTSAIAGTYYIDMDLKYTPWKLKQTDFVNNANWPYTT